MGVLHFLRMSHTITVRLSQELLHWLKETARKTGMPAGRIIRQQLERARSQDGKQRFLEHAGELAGPADLSSRKGFAR
jgi:predicted transcriptional regulator